MKLKIYLNSYELWFWRIATVILVLMAISGAITDRQQYSFIFENQDKIGVNARHITQNIKSSILNQEVLIEVQRVIIELYK